MVTLHHLVQLALITMTARPMQSFSAPSVETCVLIAIGFYIYIDEQECINDR